MLRARIEMILVWTQLLKLINRVNYLTIKEEHHYRLHHRTTFLLPQLHLANRDELNDQMVSLNLNQFLNLNRRNNLQDLTSTDKMDLALWDTLTLIIKE